jgi:6-phosphogluconolactonase
MQPISRRTFFRAAAAAACVLPTFAQSRSGVFVYIGTNTGQQANGEANGIHAYRLVGGNSLIEFSGTNLDVPNPNALAVHPNRKFVYAVHDVAGTNGQAAGAISALSVDAQSGALTLLNRQSTQGSNPTHVSVDPTGRFALVANYDSGNVAVFPVQADGSLGAASDTAVLTGKPGPNAERQKSSHPRQIQTDPTGSFAIVCDLGLDTIFVFKLEAVGKLKAHSQTAVEPGAGPRNIAYHPLGRWLYRINELNNTMTAMEWMAASGELRNIQSLSTLPESFAGSNQTAQVMVAPYGQYVYGSNLGDNSIVLFNMDAGTGEMTFLASESSQGDAPQSFSIDPNGDFLFAANQASNNVTVFGMNRKSGKLSPSGVKLDVASPANVTFLAEPVGVEARPGVTLSVFNNPTYIFDGTGLVRSSIAWNAPQAKEVDVRVNAPDGPSLGRFGNAAGVTADKWVGDGTVFFLQDVSDGKALTRDNTLGTVTVTVRTEV